MIRLELPVKTLATMLVSESGMMKEVMLGIQDKYHM